MRCINPILSQFRFASPFALNGVLRSIVLTLFLVWLSSCDKVPEMPTFDGANGKAIKMVVVNEGLFTTNTAALSVVYEDGEIVFDAFRFANNRPLGDVAQSITMINGYYFVAVNNSRRVEILDPTTFKSIANIRYEQSGSPRYITPLTDSTAFVSDLYGQMVVIRTKPPYTVVKYLDLPLMPAAIEQMTTVAGKVFGAYVDQGLAVFDVDDFSVRNMRLVEDVVVNYGAQSAMMPVDKNGKLWVYTITPAASEVQGAEFKCVDPEREEVIRKVAINLVTDPQLVKKGDIIGFPSFNRVDITPERDKIYFNAYKALQDGSTEERVQTLFTLNIETDKISEYMELPGVKKMYGMNVSPKGEVCVCDCIDFTAQRGYIRVYQPGKGEVGKYKVGVYPNSVFFPSNISPVK